MPLEPTPLVILTKIHVLLDPFHKQVDTVECPGTQEETLLSAGGVFRNLNLVGEVVRGFYSTSKAR